ncbi:MAG: hypothetical protein ND895_18070 [Pyrinomonadaceae bacterium]|nr:hypothetical protein [Pyrinomonadaceae bacterium]
MKAKRWRARTKGDLMIEVWEALDCESVGARELKEIQTVVRREFGAGSVDSPASIARTLADEGAVLRHPEVLNLDTEWRERELSAVISPDELNFSGLAEASASIKKLDTLRRKFEANSERLQLSRLREMTLKLKQDALVVARSKTVERQQQLEAREIAQWLTIWLQSPDVFDDWLSLRQRSPEFIQLTS